MILQNTKRNHNIFNHYAEKQSNCLNQEYVVSFIRGEKWDKNIFFPHLFARNNPEI